MKVKMTVTSLTGRTDGYVEIMLGMMSLAGFIRGKPKLTKRTNEDGTTTITIDGDFNAAPLGHLGTDDIEEEK